MRTPRKLIAGAVTTVLATAVLTMLTVPQARAANIITFDDNATACGGAVLCSTNGTTGYNGTLPFNLSTITSWFQVDADPSLIPGQPAQPMNAGHFRVINDTGSTVTTFSLTITDTFTSSTPSAHSCTGAQAGNECLNFQASKGAAAGGGAGEGLSGPNFDKCTNGSASNGLPCASTAGSAAADFAASQVTYNWFGLNIANGALFDITFASWDHAASATNLPEPTTLTLLGVGLVGVGIIQRRRRGGE
jgi:PEP-CTERM motif